MLGIVRSTSSARSTARMMLMRQHGRNGTAMKPHMVAESSNGFRLPLTEKHLYSIDDTIADRYNREKENKMYLTFNDYMLLFGYVSVAAFASYATHEVAGAIRTYLDMNDD